MNKLKILFLAANPAVTTQLKLDEEIRAITEKIRSSEHRDALELISAWAVRPDDLIQLLNIHKPHILHFSGHGSEMGEIYLMDNSGQPKPVSARAMKALLTTLKDNIRLVLLNACYSRVQADSLKETVDFVIGMHSSFNDSAAVIFSASFYRALGFARTIQEAFDQGVTALLLEGFLEEESTPDLLVRSGADSKTVLISERTGEGEQYARLVQQAEDMLAQNDYDGAITLLKNIPDESPLAGKANLYSGLALMFRTPFGRMSPGERTELEKYLRTAQKKLVDPLLALVCLAVLEIDYYHYHGRASGSNINLADIAERIHKKSLSAEDLVWVKRISMSSLARQKLGLQI